MGNLERERDILARPQKGDRVVPLMCAVEAIALPCVGNVGERAPVLAFIARRSPHPVPWRLVFAAIADTEGAQAMLDSLITRDIVRFWHQGTLFGPHLDAFAAQLAAQGFKPRMVRAKLCAVTWFGDYLNRQGIRAVAEITPAHMAAFLAQSKEKPATGLSLRRSAIRELLRYLERNGLWASAPQSAPVGLVEDYLRTLTEERGLCPGTVANHRRFIAAFLDHARCDGSKEKLEMLTAKAVDRFLIEAGRGYGRAALGHACATIRGLLRYLFRAGVLPSDLSASVPTPRYYALERIPCALPRNTVERMLTVVDIATRRGRRDLAILQLLVTYGLRPGEIAQLRLADIDWRRDTIHVRRSKNGRPLALPLCVEVGEAIHDYLRNGRPKTTHREVFINVYAPHAPVRSRGASDVVAHYLKKAGITSHHRGAGLLRHSLAVHMVRQGEPLKTVTDLLGHTDPRSAYQYTKLATDDLRAVALPIAEVMP
jgi:site-specific recombinase XerD